MAETEQTTSAATLGFEDMIKQRLETIKNGDKKQKLAILLTTGSMNPVHLGHVACFTKAKKDLEEKHGFTILAGILSPSDSGWCRRKEFGCFPNDVRIQLAKIAVGESDWISVGEWECSQGMIDFPVVCVHYQEVLNNAFPEKNIEVYYLCGADHATKCGLTYGRKKYGVVAMARPGYQVRTKTNVSKRFYLVQGDEFDASSTEIRSALVGGELHTVKSKLHEGVFKALQEENLVTKLSGKKQKPRFNNSTYNASVSKLKSIFEASKRQS